MLLLLGREAEEDEEKGSLERDMLMFRGRAARLIDF